MSQYRILGFLPNEEVGHSFQFEDAFEDNNSSRKEVEISELNPFAVLEALQAINYFRSTTTLEPIEIRIINENLIYVSIRNPQLYLCKLVKL